MPHPPHLPASPRIGLRLLALGLTALQVTLDARSSEKMAAAAAPVSMRRRFLLAGLMLAGLLGAGPALAEPGGASSCTQPEKYPAPAPALRPHPANTLLDPITPQARERFVRSRLATLPLSPRDWINLLTYKVEARPGLSFDDVAASLKARANKINFKFVGVNALWKDVAASTGKPTPRVEIFSFCDASLARELLDYSLEFVVLLPCRVAVVEDANQKIWLLMLDWNVRWLDDAANPDRISDALRQGAVKLRSNLEEIIQAGAQGDL